MPIVCVEQSRTTIELVTAPYTISGYHPQVLGEQEEGMADGPMYAIGCRLNSGFTSYDQALVAQPEATTKIETAWGSGASDFNFAATLWGGRLFFDEFLPNGSSDPTVCQYQYWRVPYTPGVTGAAIPFTTKPMIASGFTDTGAVFSWPVSIAWSGLADPSVALANFDYGSGLLSLQVVTDSGEVHIPTFAQFPPYNTFVPPGSALPYSTFPSLILPDTANHRNYMLTQIGSGFPGMSGNRGNRGTNFGVMYVVIADDAGHTLTSDSLSFSASDINKTLCDNAGHGQLLVTPDYFIFYMDRYEWEHDVLGLASPSNGGVVIKVAKDFSKYWVNYLTYKPGDANAQAQLDAQYNIPMIVYDGAGAIYYMDRTSGGDPTSVLIIGGAPSVTLTDAELLFSPSASFMDLSVEANRRLFVASGGTPQWMGAHGALAFGGDIPQVYLTTLGPPTDFTQNNGAGGSFGLSGTISAADGPGCSPYYVTEASTPVSRPEWRLTVSDDGSRTWSRLVKPREIGVTGAYKTRLRWLKMGQFRQRVIKLECTDPIRRNIIGIYMDNEQGSI